MSTDQRHTIVRQTIDVRFNGTPNGAAALQASLSELCRQSITAALEPVLDRYTVDGSILRIDKLEVDAGALHLDQLDERFPAMIAEALDNALGKVATAGQAIPTETHEQQTGSRIPETESAVDALLFFLRHGTLPSTFRPQSHEAFEAQLPDAWNLPDLTRQTAKALTSPTARQRFLSQFSWQIAKAMIEKLSPEAMPIIEKILDQLRRTNIPAGTIIRIERELFDETLALSATQTSIAPKELQAMFIEITARLSQIPDELQNDKFAQATNPRTKQRPSTTENLDGEAAWQTRNSVPPAHRDSEQTQPNASSEAIAESAKTPDSSPDSRETNTNDRANDKVSREQTIEPSTHKASGNQPATALQESFSDSVNGSTASKNRKSGNSRTPLRRHTIDATGEHPDERRGLYVENAGLVLLHPFLPQFFSALKVAGDEVLLQPGRALQLLHFLATGSENVPEYELVLPKILCGLAPASLAGKADTLSDEEKEESEALLSAVTRHWDVLKNTGIDALRETYLKRNGKLTRWYDGGWMLQVESKSFDILLESLPWGISMIKLPWMPHMLRVEWFAHA